MGACLSFLTPSFSFGRRLSLGPLVADAHVAAVETALLTTGTRSSPGFARCDRAFLLSFPDEFQKIPTQSTYLNVANKAIFLQVLQDLLDRGGLSWTRIHRYEIAVLISRTQTHQKLSLQKFFVLQRCTIASYDPSCSG